MQSKAPRPCFFIISRARSMRYSRSRFQLTRCCQSMPAMPKFAPMLSSQRALDRGARVLVGANPSADGSRKRNNIFWAQSLGFVMAGIALRQIKAVIAVCEEGSFTRAAQRENATQSGISQHVATVERALGVRLFDRSAAGVRPT